MRKRYKDRWLRYLLQKKENKTHFKTLLLIAILMGGILLSSIFIGFVQSAGS